LHESADDSLHQFSAQQPNLLDEVAAKQVKSRESEIAPLSTEAETREIEINDLTGSGRQPIG